MIEVQDSQINTRFTEPITKQLAGGGIDSTTDLVTVNGDAWGDVIDTMLSWLNDDNCEADRDCFETALDFAFDHRAHNERTPKSIVLNDDGTISFEWRTKDHIILYQVIELGVIEFTRIYRGHVTFEATLRRNPQTRRLEQQS